MSVNRNIPITPHKCSCGRAHFEIPKTARFQNEGDALDGWYFECACRSTLFIPLADPKTFGSCFRTYEGRADAMVKAAIKKARAA